LPPRAFLSEAEFCPSETAMQSNERSQTSTLLVAADDTEQRSSIVEMLVAAGHRVVVASQCDEVVQAFIDEEPLLVLLDTELAGAAGMDVCRALSTDEQPSATPIILMHAPDDEQAISDGLAWNVVDFLAKPVQVTLLEHRVSRALADTRAAGELASLSAATLSEESICDEAMLTTIIDEAIASARGNDKNVAAITLGIDIDQEGHPVEGHIPNVSQHLARYVRQRLQHAVSEFEGSGPLSHPAGEIRTARREGDRFVLLVPEFGRIQDASKLGQKIAESLSSPVLIEGRETKLAISLGVAAYPTDGNDAEELLKNSETARYCAKQEGSNSLQFYTESMSRWAFERLTLEHSLRDALEREEFVVYYQPRLDVATRTIIGMEALVRWVHPQLGLVSPAQFIPLAEETGLIVPIGEWVLLTACKQTRRWQEMGLPKIRMSVNLSPVQFRQSKLFQVIDNALAEASLEPEYLELEVTESMLMNDAKATIDILTGLKRAGIHLSIDDFGTGYSSLSYLKRFPIDALKIDRSFVREVTTNPDDAAIATSIILMGHSLNLEVVAEGVEDESQLAFLQVLQCDEVQGFLFSPPVPAERAEALLRTSEQARISE
jgi:EAL domain-containing protein (putative c-di-GMP-specific phosphodiesterase class I)/DNA-binding response OmpR family regulator